MARYGGVDTSRLAAADLAGRRELLQQQMASAEQTNRQFQQASSSLQQGANMITEDDAAKRRESLEAARSGLEYDESTRRYKKSQETQDRETFDFNAKQLEREQAYRHNEQSQLLKGAQVQQQIKQSQSEMTQGEMRTGIEARKTSQRERELDIDQQRENRLANELYLKTGKEREAVKQKLVDTAEARVDKLDAEYRGLLKLKAQGGREGNDKLVRSIAKKLELVSGDDENVDLQGVMNKITAKRSQIILDHVARTGDIRMIDPSAPEWQEYVGVLKVARALFRADAIINPIYQSLPYKERNERVNAFAAKALQAAMMNREMKKQNVDDVTRGLGAGQQQGR